MGVLSLFLNVQYVCIYARGARPLARLPTPNPTRLPHALLVFPTLPGYSPKTTCVRPQPRARIKGPPLGQLHKVYCMRILTSILVEDVVLTKGHS